MRFPPSRRPERESYAALHAAINRLPERLRTTVILFYFQGMDVAETAKALGVPPGTVKSRSVRQEENSRRCCSMKTIYNFEMHAPPHLTEAMLQAGWRRGKSISRPFWCCSPACSCRWRLCS